MYINQRLKRKISINECFVSKGFFNAKTGPFAKEDHYTLTVRRDHEPTPYDDSQPTEDENYKGHENSLMFLRR